MTYSPLPDHAQHLSHLDDAWLAPSAGERLERVREAAAGLRAHLLGSGRVVAVRTLDIADLPYPTPYAFAGAASSPVPYVLMTNRANLVQLEVAGGQIKTLLFNPTDPVRSAETPFFAELRGRMGDFVSGRVMNAFTRLPLADRLTALGIGREDIDYIAFDHLHTQDARGLLGSPGIPAIYPRAKLLIWRPELDILRALHPLQRPWYIPDALRGVAEDRIIPCDGDLLLGPGAALVRTPGHTVGNWSLVLNTDGGVWAISENGISCDSYAPEASRIPGVRRHARREGLEVILNSNTLEGRNEQYTSMILEKALVDRCRENPDFYQHLASSELAASPLTPGLAPTHRHGGVSSGQLRKRGVSLPTA